MFVFIRIFKTRSKEYAEQKCVKLEFKTKPDKSARHT